MQTLLAVFPFLIIAGLAAVVVTLMSGLFLMTRTERSARRSNKLMWVRVGLQATTVALILIYLLLRNIAGA